MKQAHEKIGMKRVVFVFPTGFTFAEKDGEAPKTIHVLPVGEWDHPGYGKMIINEEDISEFVEHFNAGIRRDIPITEGHESLDEKPAIGWFKELLDKGSEGLYAAVEWTERGKELLLSKAYKYFSPEFHLAYEDPETREIYTNVLVGGALTNKPYFKHLDPVVFSEPNLNSDNEPKMTLEEIVKKNPSDLSAEEKAFVKDHQADLSEEQKTAFADALKGEDAGGEGGGEGAGNGEGAGEGAGNGGEGKPPVNASEKGMVQISAAELKALQDKANKGYEAAQKLEASEITAQVSALMFSESNKAGKFLPKSKDKLTQFVKSLSEAQRKAFSELIAEVPEAKMFSEVGDGGAEETSVAKKVEEATKKVMSENNGMTYSVALKKVFAENPQLAKEYEAEYPAA